jgi:hypothetical protein
MRILAVSMLAAALGGAAHGAELSPLQARSINLGPFAGVAYYTVEPAGFRVVTTVSRGDDTRPLRFVALLGPDQTISLSIPGEASRPGATVTISRRGDRVSVEPFADAY